MLTDEQVSLIVAIGRMFYVLAYLIAESRPLRARHIAGRLRTDYETIRKYLDELARLQVITRTRLGWLPTLAGRQLVLPDPAPALEEKSAEKPRFSIGEPKKTRKNRENAEKPRFSPLITTTEIKELKESTSVVVISEKSAEKPRLSGNSALFEDPAPKSAEKPRFFSPDVDSPTAPEDPGPEDPAGDPRLDELDSALRAAGVQCNDRTRPLFRSEFLTAAHVAGHAHRLKRRKGRAYTPGLLIAALESLLPADLPPPVGYDGRDASGYAAWED